ncbi:MAG: non-homologous end-joining DNA ligase [Acidimicrobiales bacterium]|jgi:bifunctional non-homologous end joining protein LigD
MSPDGGASISRTVDGREITISRPEKVLFPATGFTKGQMIDYYATVAGVMLPHLAGRPLTMKRFPDGVDGDWFFEKHAPAHAPDWVRHVAVPSAGGTVDYTVVDDRSTLIWAADLATVEFHVPLWRVPPAGTVPGPADHLVFDLDPGEGSTIVECCRVAKRIAGILAARGLDAVPKTSGRKGLHVYSPLSGRPAWSTVRQRSHEIAVELEQTSPDLVVSNMRRSLRPGRVLVDWSQNAPAKTTVAAYSLRASSEPGVSTPVTWEEVERCGQAGDPSLLRFSPTQVVDRIERLGDLFAAV